MKSTDNSSFHKNFFLPRGGGRVSGATSRKFPKKLIIFLIRNNTPPPPWEEKVSIKRAIIRAFHLVVRTKVQKFPPWMELFSGIKINSLENVAMNITINCTFQKAISGAIDVPEPYSSTLYKKRKICQQKTTIGGWYRKAVPDCGWNTRRN